MQSALKTSLNSTDQCRFNKIFYKLNILQLFTQVSSTSERGETRDRLEMIFVWTPDSVDLSDVQKFFSGYNPLNVEQVTTDLR